MTMIDSVPTSQEGKSLFKESTAADIDHSFRDNIIAEIDLLAGDDTNAREKALKECRRTIDALNFYSDIFANSFARARVAFLGESEPVTHRAREGEKERLMVLLRKKYDPSESAIDHNGMELSGFAVKPERRGPLSELRIPDTAWKRAIETGFARLSELLAKDNRSPLDERILAAFQWAGRATVDLRLEEAFLLYMIALESMVLGKSVKAEITFQLKLKTAHLIGGDLGQRKRLSKRLSDLYDTRSKIVHTGSFQVTEAEVREVRHYVKSALVGVITNDMFNDMQTPKEFDEWLDDQLISEAAPSSPQEQPESEQSADRPTS